MPTVKGVEAPVLKKVESPNDRLLLKMMLEQIIWLKREVSKSPYNEGLDAGIVRLKELING